MRQPTGTLRVLFDEAHSEAWTIDPATALAMNPVNPGDAGYTQAAELLRSRGYEIEAHRGGAFTPELLQAYDTVVMAHPSEPRWERTTGIGTPVLSAEELDAVEAYVRGGGGLVVMAECAQDLYGSNLVELLGRFGVGVDNVTVQDGARRHHNVATWVLADKATLPESAVEPEDILAGVQEACFYRAGALNIAPGTDAVPLFVTSATADPAGKPLALAVRASKGRVAVFADSDLFGDDSIAEYDHRTLWFNTLTWASRRPASAGAEDGPHSVAASAAFAGLKAAIEELRPFQGKDGAIDLLEHDGAVAGLLVDRIVAAVEELSPHFPHDADYLAAVLKDLRRWSEGGFQVPDFLDSLMAFQPAAQRADGLEHLVVFPMYTQNGNLDRNLETLITRTVWPDWLAALERDKYPNPQFVPIEFAAPDAFTAGYDTNSAVLFPETVAVRETPIFTWGGILCDREAARFRMVTTAAAKTLKLSLPPDAARLLDDQKLAQEAFVLWDLVHDRTHSHGDLPFDPFMIKQRMPYFLYSLEELRCDLTAFRAAVALEAEGGPGSAHAKLVQYAILFDRLFRFPITGGRVRNYDGLGGQLLFAYLHRNDVIRWTDNRLTVDWPRVADAVIALGTEVETLYRDGIDRPKPSHWLAAYGLVSGYVQPNPASVWARGAEALPLDGPPKGLVDAVLPDEFPLSMFYEALSKKLAPVVEATRGVTG
jgi:hypothetical protein